MPAGRIRSFLEKAGSPFEPEEIGLTWESMRNSYRGAQQIRRRYTVLDLAVEADFFDDCEEELFRPGGYWSEQRSEAG